MFFLSGHVRTASFPLPGGFQVARIFERVNEDTSRKFTVTGSYIEIYNNEINDLLAAQEQQQPLASGWASASSGRSGSHARPQKRQKIDIRYASGRGDITFTGGLTEVVLDSKEKARGAHTLSRVTILLFNGERREGSPARQAASAAADAVRRRSTALAQQAEELLADGDERRKTAATKMNDHSSRSHAVLLVRITSRPTTGAWGNATPSQVMVSECSSALRSTGAQEHP